VASETSEHRAPLEALGVSGPPLGRLAAYLDTLAAWSVRVNLTGARSPAERARLLVGSVLAAAALPASGRLVDIGSGNGSPGLVLALLRDDLEVTLLEPRARRWAFLREAARAAGRSGVRVLRLRHDAYPGPPAETATLRALALPLGELRPLVAPGGRLVVFGVPPEPGPGFEPVPAGVPLPGGITVFRRIL
jgi:16S rRNA (guanine527-N7)-methyltransferase